MHKVEEGAETDAWDSLNIYILYVNKDNYCTEFRIKIKSVVVGTGGE